jgi:hypothetical protein
METMDRRTEGRAGRNAAGAEFVASATQGWLTVHPSVVRPVGRRAGRATPGAPVSLGRPAGGAERQAAGLRASLAPDTVPPCRELTDELRSRAHGPRPHTPIASAAREAVATGYALHRSGVLAVYSIPTLTLALFWSNC